MKLYKTKWGYVEKTINIIIYIIIMIILYYTYYYNIGYNRIIHNDDS